MCRRAIAVCLALYCLNALALASVEDQNSGGRVRWLVSAQDADRATEARTFRVFGAPDQLTLSIFFSNGSATPFVLPQADLQQFVGFTVSSDVEVGIVAEWHAARSQTAGQTVALPSSSIQLDPGQGMTWPVTLRRTDRGQFSVGRYEIRIAIGNGDNPSDRSAPAWINRLAVRDTSIFVITGDPTSDHERGAAHRQIGKRALDRGRPEDALAALEAAVAADGSNPVSLIALGDAFLRLGRFREAVSPLEKAISVMPPEGSGVPSRLAMAYLGLNDEPSAIRVLQRTDMSAERVQSESVRLREQLARRPK